MKKMVLIMMSLIACNVYAGENIDKIRESGKVVLGVRSSSAPFSSVQPDGSYDGYAVSICKEVVKNLSKEFGKPLSIEYKEIDTSTRYTLIDAGVIDMECAGSTYNPDKLAVANYAIEYTDSVYAAGKKTMANISLNELATKRIGIVAGFIGEKYVRQFYSDRHVDVTEKNLQKAQTYDGLFLLLKQNRIDAIVTNKSVLVGEIAKQRDADTLSVFENGNIKNNEKLGIVLPAKDQDFSNKVKGYVKTMFKTGLLENWSKQYFKAPLSTDSNRDIAENK